MRKASRSSIERAWQRVATVCARSLTRSFTGSADTSVVRTDTERRGARTPSPIGQGEGVARRAGRCSTARSAVARAASGRCSDGNDPGIPRCDWAAVALRVRAAPRSRQRLRDCALRSRSDGRGLAVAVWRSRSAAAVAVAVSGCGSGQRLRSAAAVSGSSCGQRQQLRSAAAVAVSGSSCGQRPQRRRSARRVLRRAARLPQPWMPGSRPRSRGFVCCHAIGGRARGAVL